MVALTPSDGGAEAAAPLGPRTWAAGLLLGAVTSVCGATGFWPVFGWRAIAPTVVVAALAPAIAHLLLRTWKRPRPAAWATVGTAGGLTVLGLLATALRPTLTERGGPLRAMREGVTDGWAQLLSTSLPADPEPQLLVVVALVILAASVGQAELWTRSRARALLGVPPVLALGVGLSLGGGAQAARHPLPVAGLAVGTAGLLVLRRSLEPATAGPRRMPTVPIAVAVVAMAVVALVSPWMAGAGRSARGELEPPQLPLSAQNPLVDLLAQRAEAPDSVLAQLEGAGEGWWQIGILDAYDGARWGESGRYQSAGRATPLDFLPTRLGPTRRTEVRLERPLVDRRLAIPANMVRLDAEDAALLINERTGARLGARSDGQDLSDYAVIWRPLDLRGIERAVPGAGAAATDGGFPPLPTALTDFAAAATDGSRSWFQQAAALERGVAQALKLDKDAPPDTSLGRLCDLALQRAASRCDLAPRAAAPGAPERRGVAAGPEQAASLFAVLARSRGLPSRLAIGFPTAATNGTSTVHARDLVVRPEVLFEGYGWVAFDPSPQGTAARPPPAPATGTSSAPPAPCPDLRCAIAQNGQPPPDDATGGDPVAEAEAPGGLRLRRLLLAGLVLVLIVLLIPSAIVVTKAVRRARRRAGPPRAQVQGAWDEVVDRLLELRIAVPRHAGPDDAGGLVSPRRPDLERDMAGFAALLSPGLWSATEPDAAAVSDAWTSAAVLRARLWAGIGPAQRLRASVSIAPLRRARA